MKKTVLSIMAIILIAFNTEAQQVKKRFVFFSNAKKLTKEEAVPMLKAAMVGGNITGADVRCNAANYIEAWGSANYQIALAADISRWSIVPSKGGVTNCGVDSVTKKTVPVGTLNAGVDVLALDGVEVAKLGSDNCFNALLIPPPVVKNGGDESDDPDNMVIKKTTNTFKGYPGNVFNNVNNNNATEISWNEGYGIYAMGRGDRTSDFAQDMLMFQALSKGNGCCGGGSTNSATITSGTPTLYATGMSTQQQTGGVVYIKETADEQKIPFGQTWFGNATATAAGNLLSDGIEWVIDRVTGQRVQRVRRTNYVTSTPTYNNAWPEIQGGTTLFANYPATTNGLVTTNQSILPLSNNLGAGSNGTGYSNQWAEQQRQLQLQQYATSSYGGLVRIGN